MLRAQALLRPRLAHIAAVNARLWPRRATSTSIQSSLGTPLTAIRPGHELDNSKLISYLKDRGVLDGNVDNYAIKQFANGQSNPTFVVCSGQRNLLVVRKQPPGKLLKGAHAVDREHQVMSSLAKETGPNSVPVPIMRGFCDDPSIVGTPFFFYDYVHGRFFKDPSLPSAVSPEERRNMYFSMIDTLARIHCSDIKKLDLTGFTAKGRADAPSEPYVLRQITQWSKMYKATATETIDDMNELMRELPKAYPSCNGGSLGVLVHGDYRIDNLLFEPQGPNVLAVLDWELSTLGDNMADIAYFCMSYDFEPDNPFFCGLKGRDLVQLGIPSKEEVLRMYTEQMAAQSSFPSSYAHIVAGEIDYYSAFAFFRSCAILQVIILF
jgi:acyl-CoA dehydrogenase family protein 10